ncbi:ATP-dependent helicase HrpB [Planctomycetaceae bacterium SCGC AG-212-F19]|nr:ATP-dependent helicase HrpB [Planctomycetaceae bacterium SCGC AG-212-F19]
MSLVPLPIDAILPELVAALRGRSAVVLRAPTGAGKTTRVPPALLDAALAGKGRIVMLEPRRLAARAAARRISAERGGRLGDEIGYHVRFDRQCGPQTRIVVVTPGILLRMLHDDPYLESVGIIVFDEFHERSLDADLALGMARLIQQTVRPELRVVVMSATLAVDRIAGYLSDCPVVVSEGRQHPVDIVYEARLADQPWPVAAAGAAERLLERTAGGLLVFLPGMQEIRQTARHLEESARQRDLAILPLHGDLPAEQQDAALLPSTRRKVVLATNVAETSVTVEGITGVVDTGLARVMHFDPSVGLDRLRLVPISRSSADQRAGRAGRTQPGVCVRLWSEVANRSRPEEIEPEIRRVDLAGAVLHLLALGETDIRHFPWLEPPREATVEQALALLRRLSAIAENAVTELGRILARLPVHPRIGRLLVEGHREGVGERAALAAALLSERDPFVRSVDGPLTATHSTASDVLDRVEALDEYERRGENAVANIHRNAARFILRARDQLLRSLRQEMRGTDPQSAIPNPQASDAFLRALLAAFPDRVAKRREPGSRRGVMVGGRGVSLAPASGVNEPELFLCVDVDAGQNETLVRQASAVRRDWLPAKQVRAGIEVAFDAAEEKVVARRVLRYEDLVIEETHAALPNDDTVGKVLATAAAERLDRVLPPPDSPAGEYFTRIRCLREWMPELQLPAFDEAEQRELLSWLTPRCRSFADLRRADWLAALHGKLTHPQRQAVEREAPERIEVPSGSRIALRYELGRPPVLAVRIQELFGLADTPRVAAGRVPVLLHLLAPNYRPQQVTDDLASFWHNTYQQVRKELRARYPKHAWPEDPWTATPQRRPARRRTEG